MIGKCYVFGLCSDIGCFIVVVVSSYNWVDVCAGYIFWAWLYPTPVKLSTGL